MKNYLKLQAKKSMSLFLAVLMVLSCWVWMAPEVDELEAEAANITPATQYTVEVSWSITNKSISGGDIKYKTLGDGWGSESDYIITLNSMSDKTGTGNYTHSWTTTNFPTVVRVNTTGGGGTSKSRTTVNYIKINGKTVYHGGEGWDGPNSCEFYPNYNSSNFGTSGSTNQTYTWPRPMITGFVDSNATENTDEIDVTLNKIGGANVEGSTSFDISKYNCYNQYGVKISSLSTYISQGRIAKVNSQSTHVSDSNNSDDPSEFASDIWASTTKADTVVVSPNLQVSNPQGSSGKDSFYLVRTYVMDDGLGGTVTSKASAKVNVTYPKYTVNFNSGLSDAKIPYGADTPAIGTYSPSAYNGGNIAVPDNKATNAPGYTFLGYWSKQQPSTGNASYNAAASVFASPCSTDDYNAYKAASGSTEANGIVTDADGNRWYDAGVAMDPGTVKTIDVSENYKNFTENWYGWWIAKDLVVKFYDVDGQFLGEKLVKAGQTVNDITWPTSKYVNTGYTSGAIKFTVDSNIWVNSDGYEINKTDGAFRFSKDLMLTPLISDKDITNKYTVNFINPNNGSSIATGKSGQYDYRENIESYADVAYGKLPVTPDEVDGDLQYRYELLGWSSVKPSTGKNYHVILEDADFDVNGNLIGLNKDWIVRGEATYYAVYRRYTKTYVVNFNYKDATGADAVRQLKFKYGATLAAPTDYVPYAYVTKGFGYTFDKWSYTDGSGNDATFKYADTIPFTSEYIEIVGGALEGLPEGEFAPLVITATYGAPVATPYTVTFNYVDDEGNDDSSSVEVRNEQFILQTTVDNLQPAEEWENEDKLYTYADKWEITEGSATVGVGGPEKKVGDIINTADLSTLTPTSNITFKAVYANPVPYYTVTYIDGDKTFTDRVLQGSDIPAWMDDDKVYVPADYEGEGGTYEFQGWFDAKEGGNKIDITGKVEGNLTLYSQFKFVPDTFTITFMNHDGSVQLGAGKYEKGQDIQALVTTATMAAQGRASDNTYDYIFLGWDKPVPTFCEGYDVTFTALYKPVYRYYDAKWYNSTLVNGNWVADKSTSEVEGETVETNLLATTHHTYNSKLYTPAVDNLTCLETAPNGQTYTFAGWYYNDADGNAVKYERGMTITAEMEFYATFNLSAKIHTVTTVVKGVSTKYEVADGATAEIPEPQAGYVDADKHDAFAGWFTDEDYTDAFDLKTEITADTKLYAKFETNNHSFTEEELVKAPTYYAEGEMAVWCDCNREKTEKKESIEMLTDKVVPTGTIYLGEHLWSSEGDAANLTDGDPISIFVNSDTDVIITSNDTGDVNALYNPSGIGKGVKYIRAFAFPAKYTLTADNYSAAQGLTTDVYVDETEALTNNANFAIKLGDIYVADLNDDGGVQYDGNGEVMYKELESGEDYIIYYYVVDKAGNQLNRKVRTAKFTYDDEAPVFKVEGASNEAAVPTYCGVATVTGLEKDVTLKVNGEIVTATYEDGAETGTYKINYAEGMDNVIITATDKAGNEYSKKIKVADHSYLHTKQKASCGVEGFEKEECIICGHVKTNKTYPALEHIWSDRSVVPADCVNNGKVVVKCSICSEEIITEFEEDGVTPVVPALGHTFERDVNDEIIYTTVTESTCKTKGIAEAFCTECNGELKDGRITTELELNKDNHEDISITEVLPDCITNGSYTEACSCGVTIEYKDHTTDPETYAAKGHGTIEAGTAEWYVRTEPTCYQKGEKVLKCLVCSNFVTVDGEEVTEEIEATGEHIKTVTNPDSYKTDGAVKYHCATPGCPHKYDDKPYVDDSLKEYTVTFKSEDGATTIYTFTQLEGTAIAKDVVTAPTKADSTDGKFKYTFAGWADKDGKIYKLPLTVTADLELKATFKETTIKYTHQFVVPTTWTATSATDDNTVVYATLVGAIGDVRKASGTPVFKSNDADADLYSYEFIGWKHARTEAMVTDFTVAGDATFIAVFERTAITYKVTYYNGTDFVWQTTVDAGESVTFGGTAPTKNFDDSYHYAFEKWYTDAGLSTEYTGGAITADTRLYAGFKATAHSYDKSEGKGTVTQERDCLLPELTEYACACGHKIEEETAQALGHKLGEYTYDKESGKMVAECERCDYTVSYNASATINFVNESGLSLQITTVQIGGEVQYTEALPEKAADKEYTYTFAGWVDLADADTATEAKYAPDYVFTDIKEDATYVAFFTATARRFVVRYVDNNNGYAVVHYFKDTEGKEITYKYGDPVPAAPAGVEAKLVVPAYEQHGHYVFDGWNLDEGATVTGDMYITAEFMLEDHAMNKSGEVGATCTEKGGIEFKCTCGYRYVDTDANLPALGHLWDEGTVTLEPDYNTQTDGVRTYKCTRCDATKEEAISGKARSIKVTVKDENGTAIEHAEVRLLKNGEIVKVQTTNNEGVTIFTGLDNGSYSVYVVDTNTSYSDIVVNEDGSVKNGDIVSTPEKEEIDASCKCTCHKNTFWGMIFRFFQKIIKLFTGKPTCCACPSDKI